VKDYTEVIKKIHKSGAKAIVNADLLSLCLIKSAGEMDADIAIGSN